MIHSNIEQYTIGISDSIERALEKIDANNKGFLVVIDCDDKVLGVITDGDIRRYILRKHTISGSVEEAYTSEFVSLSMTEQISQSIDIFKREEIKFLPIVDGNKKLVSIITKGQMQVMLLQDLILDTDTDYLGIDERIIDFEVYSRPWGFYKTTVLNDYFQSKVIIVNPKSRLSLQYHNHREEHWVIVHGNGKVQIGGSIKAIQPGDYVYIPKKTEHRIENVDDKENLIVTEIQIGEYLGEDDIIRIEDDYDRYEG